MAELYAILLMSCQSRFSGPASLAIECDNEITQPVFFMEVDAVFVMSRKYPSQ